MSSSFVVLAGGTAKREPLPAFPAVTSSRGTAQVWASSPYRTDLAVDPPAGRDRRFWRGNFSGVYVPGAPGVKDGKNATVPGGDTSFVYSSHLPRYPLEWQHRICAAMAARGYTHIFLDLWNTIGHEADQLGAPLETFIAAAKVAQAHGLFVDVSLLSGPRDQTWAYWQPIITPIVQALHAAGVLDLATIGMQLDLWNSPYGLRTIIEGLGGLIKSLDPSIPVASHWANHACAWFGADHNGDSGFPDRFAFWNHWHANGLMDWAYFQADTRAPLDDLEGRVSELRKTCDVVPFELTAQAQFDPSVYPGLDGTIEIDEAHGDLVSFAAMCATGGPYRIAGYGNGGRRPDGSRL